MTPQEPRSPTAAEQVAGLVEAVQDDPRRRRELAAAVYEPRPGRADVRSYRRAELALMQWQMSRGVLAPAHDERPGSPWWRAVNAGLLRDACEADLLLAGTPGTPSRPAVARWRHFLESPSPASWYRAHNASIVTGYVDHRHLAAAELPVERFFMDVTLARVLFVHGLLMYPQVALGRWLWPCGRLGDPRWRGVDIYLSLKNVLLREYPLIGRSIESVLDAEDFWGRLVDYGILIPRVQELYEYAAADLQQPHLLTFVASGNPVYAWPDNAHEVWHPRKHRRLIKLVKRVTPHPVQVITAPDGWPLWTSPVRPGREHDTTALRRHDILPLLITWTDDDLRVLGDLGYEGEQATITVAFKKPKNRSCTTIEQQFNRAHNAVRAIGERGNSLLKTMFKALRNVSLCPWTIGRITAAALVILHIEHGRTT